MTEKRAVFLDRDGTINLDPGYLSHPDQMQLFAGVGPALAQLHQAGFTLIIVSNQSGVGRGLIKQSQIPAIHMRLNDLLSHSGVKLDHFELCFHKPEDECECRKPKPKLLLEAARRLGINLAESYMVGDKLSDIEVGHNAGCKASVLVRTGNGLETETMLKPGQAAVIVDDFSQAAQWILRQGI